MIHADLYGKRSVAEDVFTSNCLDLLSLLPDRDLLDFFMIARTCRQEPLRVPAAEQAKLKVDFWPYLPRPRGCIPDAIVTIEDDQLSAFKLIIEVKLGAAQTGDQLADYWNAGAALYPNRFMLVYLTNHRSLPKLELETSECRAGPTAKIYWLSWYDFFLWTEHQLGICSLRPNSEERIIRMLQFYLSEKGYRTFLGWQPWKSKSIPTPYGHTYLQSLQPAKQNLAPYVRAYFNVSLAAPPPLPYVYGKTE